MQDTKKQSYLLLGLVIAVFLGIIWEFYPLPDASRRIDNLPLKGQNFVGYIVPLTDWERENFKGINVIKRIYQVGNQHAFIYVLDGTNNRHLVHDPTFCFRGSGWEVTNNQPFALNNGTANLATLSKGTQSKEAMYWFTDGRRPYQSTFRYWWQTSLRRITLGMSGPEPVLVVIQPIATPTLNWQELIDNFPELTTL